ncbi:MAG TPA: hypothetical protein VK986_25975 [Tepidisphaeraceae bacterium]|nr:hypothetical protein [Tepidisphaeraceae bacterium]
MSSVVDWGRPGGLTAFRREVHERTSGTVSIGSRRVVFPLWVVVVLAAVLPTVLVVRWQRRLRQACFGMCLTCGYDLRGHAPGARCPECGTGGPVEAPAVRSAG